MHGNLDALALTFRGDSKNFSNHPCRLDKKKKQSLFDFFKIYWRQEILAPWAWDIDLYLISEGVDISGVVMKFLLVHKGHTDGICNKGRPWDTFLRNIIENQKEM